MTIDANSLCPGGTGKKIKHCECRDIVGDLEKIGKALEGGQRVAALDRINRVLATKAHRPCLLALKASTLMQMNELQSFEDTVTTFVKVAPQNSFAHCFASILESRKQRVREAVDATQSVFEYTEDNYPGELVLAMAQLTDLLVRSAEFLSARAHAAILNIFAPDEEVAQNAIMALSSMPEIPLVLKTDRALMTCPEGVSWKSRFDTALAEGNRLRWRKSLGKFEKLNEEFPQTPAILWNIALLRSLLALPHQAEAWRAFAQCPASDPKQAVDAESVAQILRYRDELPEIALMKWTAEVTDANELSERLLSTPGIVSLPVDPRLQGRDDQPPPKGLFQLLDRPVLADDVEVVTADNVPRRLASLMLFGRETDRPARLDAVLVKNDAFDSVIAKLNEIGGSLLTGDRQEEVIDMAPRLMMEIDPACHFPPRTRPAVRRKVSDTLMQQNLEKYWPHIAVESLGGKSPAEVVADPAWRIPLEAALIMLESIGDISRTGWDVDALRQSMGLPIPAPIILTGDVDQVPLPDLRRVDPEKLDDEQLAHLYGMARLFVATKAMWRFGNELLRRGCLKSSEERYQLLLELSQYADDPDAPLSLLAQAKKEAAASNISPAGALLAELSLRLTNGDGPEAQEVLNTLQARHMREPGVPELLFRLLREHGIIRDEHLEKMQQATRPAPAQRPPAAEMGSALWTPDAPAPSREGEQPSKLWLPD